MYLPPVLINVGRLALRRGQAAGARAPAERALELARAHGDRDAIADASFVLAQAVAGHDSARARELALAASTRYAAIGLGGLARLGAVKAWLAGPMGPGPRSLERSHPAGKHAQRRRK